MSSRSLAAAAREQILHSIVVIRSQKVILDQHLAALYEVPTKVLLQAVKRNSTRFPADFMFRLSPREFRNLRSQIVTSSSWGGRRTAPYAFTEQGVAMLSSVLRSRRAIAVNIEIMRAFVRLRRIFCSTKNSAAESMLSKNELMASSKSFSTRFRALITSAGATPSPS